ncbi:Sister chromatid cohesion protein 2, partial [Linderina pennispora]
PGFGADKRKVVEECLKEYTKITHRSTKAMPSHVSYAKAADAARAIFASLPLYRSFDMIVSRMAMSLGSSLVTVRSKALRALNHVASHRPSVLYQPNVKFAINHRLQDNSSLVREAAIDLIGKHVAQNPELTSQYYEFISVRALDKGTSVRKRVMRILRDIYLASDDQSRLVDIGVRVLQRTNDEERTIREFAMKTLQEL